MRLRRLFSLTLAAALILSACGPAADSPAATRTATPPAAPETSIPAPIVTPPPALGVDPAALNGIRIQVWHALSGASEEFFLSRMARFNSVNEWNITVDQAWQGDYPSLFEALNAALEGGPRPDVVLALPEQALAWDSAGAVVDLTPYLGDPVWGLAGGEAADFPPVIWGQDEVNGRRLGVPAERSARLLFYNVTWARELGFASPPVTAEEFRQQACAANASFRRDASEQNDGYGGWIVDADWQTVYPWLLAFGGGVTDKEDGYQFESEANLAALQFLKALREDGCAWMPADPQNPFATPRGPFYEQFARRLALFITGDLTEAADFSAALERLGSTDEWTVLPFPGPAAQALTVYGPSYTLLASTPERQLAAWIFLRWMIAPENLADWAAAAGVLPLRAAAADRLSGYRSAHPQWAAAVDLLPLARGAPQRADWRTIRYVLADGTLSIFRLNLPAAEIPGVLAEMEATAEELSKK